MIQSSATAEPPPLGEVVSPLVPILANPYSGNGPNRRFVSELVAALIERNLEPQVSWERSAWPEMLADRDWLAGCRCIVAAGGDGSIAEVLNGMPVTGGRLAAAVSTLPMGNENLFARQFCIRRDPAGLAEAIARGCTVEADLGVAGQRRFSLMASCGLDADVVDRVTRWRLAAGTPRRVTSASYIPRILASLRDYGYPRLTIEADGQTFEGSHVFVFNMPQYGGGLGICRHADASDGHLDYVVFERRGVARVLDYGLAVLTRRHLRRGDVVHGQARSVRITADRPVAVQADGDPAATTPCEIRVLPGALQVVRPVVGADL